MRLFRRQIKSKWYKAAAIGSLWGSIEIILGSYLHNLKIPLVGTIMTFIAIFLLSVFTYVWKERGIAWRAGLIAALLKSISPSAVLIGPMTAIFLEGLLFDIGIYAFGNNLIGFIIGGILAETSVIFHKILSLFIVYGSDIVQIADNFYNYLIKQLPFKYQVSSLEALFSLILIYSIIGSLASFLGYLKAKKLAKIKIKNIDNEYFEQLLKQNNYSSQKPVKFSQLYVIIANILIASFLLWLLNHKQYIYYLAFIVAFPLAYVGFYKKYKNAFKFIKKRAFWIQLLIVFVLAVVFYQNDLADFEIDYYSLIAGLKLVFRSLIIILLFSTLSVQLNSPIITNFLLRRGKVDVYLTLGFASSVVPYFIKTLTEKKKNNSKFFLLLYEDTIKLYNYFANKIVNTAPSSL